MSREFGTYLIQIQRQPQIPNFKEMKTKKFQVLLTITNFHGSERKVVEKY